MVNQQDSGHEGASGLTIDPEAIAAALPKGKRPPLDQWSPDYLGDIDMRIARDGSWHYMGSPIGRERLVKLFAGILRREADDRYYLVTPVEKYGIVVEDAPFIAVAMTAHGSGRDQVLTFRSNVDDEIMADAAHPIRLEVDATSGEPAPYVLVRDRLEALIARPVYYDLVDLAVADEIDGAAAFGVWSAGSFFPLGDPGELDL